MIILDREIEIKRPHWFACGLLTRRLNLINDRSEVEMSVTREITHTIKFCHVDGGFADPNMFNDALVGSYQRGQQLRIV